MQKCCLQGNDDGSLALVHIVCPEMLQSGENLRQVDHLMGWLQCAKYFITRALRNDELKTKSVCAWQSNWQKLSDQVVSQKISNAKHLKVHKSG